MAATDEVLSPELVLVCPDLRTYAIARMAALPAPPPSVTPETKSEGDHQPAPTRARLLDELAFLGEPGLVDEHDPLFVRLAYLGGCLLGQFFRAALIAVAIAVALVVLLQLIAH